MTQPLNAAERPNRLSLAIHIITLGLLGLSFISGIMIWRGVHLQGTQGETPAWLRGCVVFHGALNPFLCALFGYFLCDHIRVGWRLAANRVSGFLMEACFAALILSGVGLYYSGGETFRNFCVVAHRALGVALPISLAVHWIAARRWVANVAESSKFQVPSSKEAPNLKLQ